MMHRAWSSIVEVPYCFSRSSVKFQGHAALKIVEFDPNWAFPDCNSSLNSPMAMKCCTKLETAKERCPIVFQGHPSNFEVTRYKTSPILTQIGRFRTIGRSQLSNPSDLPCFVRKHQCAFAFYIFRSHWNGTGGWNPPSWTSRTCQSNRVNTMAADDLTIQGTRASAVKSIDLLWYSDLTARRGKNCNIICRTKVI